MRLKAQMHRLALWLVELDRYPKRAILAVNDFILFNVALWLALSFRLGEAFVPQDWQMLLVLAAAPFLGIATFFQLRVYRMVTRFIGVAGLRPHGQRGRAVGAVLGRTGVLFRRL